MKVQPKLVFCHGRQTLIVKTWERISEIKPKGGKKETKDDHYIKTIRIFNNQFTQVKSILVEQVKVDHDKINKSQLNQDEDEGINKILPCYDDTSTF